MRLKDKVALVTGAGSGIGRAVSVLFAAEGASVVACDVNTSEALATADAITAAGGRVFSLTTNVAEPMEAMEAVMCAVESFERLDVVVNSAGITARHPSLEGATADEAWARVIEVNLTGTYNVCRYAAPVMEFGGGGSIINLASVMGLVGYPMAFGDGFNPYPVSKGGVVQFTRTLAVDSARKGIRVNCLCPGFIETDMTRGLREDPEMLAKLKELHPMGRLGTPDEVANVALYLASDESKYVTGTALTVDGGYTAW